MDILLIGILGFVMGVVTSISGGAGVFAVPTLLAFGLPPVNALALNRMSDVGVVLGALKNFSRAKTIDWKLALKIVPFLAGGAFVGAKVVVGLPEEVLNPVILAGVIVGIFFLLKPVGEFKKLEKPTKVKLIIGFSMLFLVGAWNGALAMAGATFAVLVLVNFFNQNFLEARSIDIVAAIPETLISTTILVMAATVNYSWLATMFISSFVGAWVGSTLAIKHGSSFIRKAMVVIALVMLTKVIVDFW